MDISRYIPFAKRFTKKSATPVKGGFFFKLHEKLPRFSFSLSLFITLIGFLFLLTFPALVLILPLELYDTVMHARDMNDWIEAATMLTLIVLGAAFSWAIFRLKFSVPTGLEITKEKFPHLTNLIEELQSEFGNPKISRILIREQYEIQIMKTPKNGMPFLNTRTLIIGLPVLQTMSPLYFKALLARRIGQLSTQHTPVTTRLYFLNNIWPQFHSSCKQSKNGFAKMLGYFFKIYNPIYKKILAPVLQEEELQADRYSMDIINHDDMNECLVYEEVVTQFLKNKFWPKIYHMAKRSKVPEFTPYSQITKVAKAGITDKEISETIQAALKADTNSPAIMPSLTRRLNHLGHAKPLPPKRLTQTAAELLLGNNLDKIIQLFDKRWMAKMKGKK